jgi:hypothetical protein
MKSPPEDACVVCGKWPASDRWALREMIEALPLDEEPICDQCLSSFFARFALAARPLMSALRTHVRHRTRSERAKFRIALFSVFNHAA